jgi:hypothetical protein
MLTQEPELTPGVSGSGILPRVRGFVQENSLGSQRGFGLAEDDSFFEKGALDSKYVAANVPSIEEERGDLASPCEISEENLGSVRASTCFGLSKRPFTAG